MRRIISIILTVIFLVGVGTMTACKDNSDEVFYRIQLIAEEGGTVEGQGEISFQIKSGAALQIKAEPLPGYRFVEWDDGVTDATRTVTVTDARTYTAKFEIRTYMLQYLAGEHGRIEGKSEQGLLYQEDGEEVTAIADEGYTFTGWTDGVETATRQDLAIENDIYVTAMFGQLQRTYYYDLADLYPQGEIKLSYGETENVKLVVPMREHFTFNGWKLNNEIITDEQGNLTVGDNIFNLNGNILEGDWTPDATYEYKILVVYVTEFKGTLNKGDGSGTVDVDYKMTELERELCHAITKKYKDFLNDAMDGLVTFEVDEYFTTQILGLENVTVGGAMTTEGDIFMDNGIFANHINEVQDLLNDYRSVIVSCNLKDYNYDLHMGDGVSGKKYGCVYLDSRLRGYEIENQEPLKNLLDLEHEYWNKFFEPYIHELIHTMELYYYPNSLYHHSMNVFGDRGDNDRDIYLNYDLHISKLFLLEDALVDGQKVGIPYRFWQGILE